MVLTPDPFSKFSYTTPTASGDGLLSEIMSKSDLCVKNDELFVNENSVLHIPLKNDNENLDYMYNSGSISVGTQVDLSILSWNIQGIGGKLELDSINTFFAMYDIIFLFETMKLDSFTPHFPNYHYVHCERKYQHPRARRPAGGIAVLIKDSVKHLVTVKKVAEYVIWLGIKQRHPQPDLIIGGTYIPPIGSKVYLNTNGNDFFQSLQDDIGNFLHSSSLLALCGDFNGRTGGLNDIPPTISGKDVNEFYSQYNTSTFDRTNFYNPIWYTKSRMSRDKMHNNYGKEIIQLCYNANVRIMNGLLNANNTDEFTCHASLGKSTVDYLLSTQQLSEIIEHFAILPKLVESDHVPLTFSVKINSSTMKVNKIQSNKNKVPNNSRFKYVFDKERVPHYKQALSEQYAQEQMFYIAEKIAANENSDTIIDTAYNFLKYGIEPNFTKKYIRSTTNTFPTNSWYDDECKMARKQANMFAKTHDLIQYNSQYKQLCSKYKSIVQRKKRLQLQSNRDSLYKLNSTNQTECWKLWNKLTGNNKIHQNTPDMQTFHKYFTEQVKPPDCEYFDQDYMDEITDSEIDINSTVISTNPIAVTICDSRITESEVALHLKKLKSNKAAGIDGITGEFYKCITEELVTPFCTMFNYIFDKGDYPSQWAGGLINALHKKGDPVNPDNYRKITITVAMAKIFESILNARLYFKNDALLLDDPFQFGFTPSRGTTDCVFVLDTIINFQKSKKKPTYLCFVDFTKAFDYINRKALYYKLNKQGMSEKMLNITISMFDKAQARVQQQGEIGPPIDSLFGVLQGGILSPKLFNEFLYDLQHDLQIENGILIEGTHFTHLLYADDIVLLADSATGLQNSINCLKNFCSKWHLIVNTSKTKVMSIGCSTIPQFTFNNEVIENVETYKYLGSVLDKRKSLHNKMIGHIANQAHKALFALRGKLKSAVGCAPPQLALKLFDSYVLPILEYNSVIWSQTSQIQEIEKIQLQYLKSMMNVRKQTSTLSVYAETGRFPLHLRQKIATINYWAKIKRLPNTDILHKCLKIQENIAVYAKKSWYNKLIHIINESQILDYAQYKTFSRSRLLFLKTKRLPEKGSSRMRLSAIRPNPSKERRMSAGGMHRKTRTEEGKLSMKLLPAPRGAASRSPHQSLEKFEGDGRREGTDQWRTAEERIDQA